jgi:hypothetical protein
VTIAFQLEGRAGGGDERIGRRFKESIRPLHVPRSKMRVSGDCGSGHLAMMHSTSGTMARSWDAPSDLRESGSLALAGSRWRSRG